MGKLFFVGVLIGAWWLLARDSTRHQVMEVLRDASDALMMFFLRSTSGFASDVSKDVLAEERERRLRWR